MFTDIFESHYPNTPILPWEMRERLSNHWFRIHSLPDSKRYPENESEWQTLFSRHQSVAEDVIGSGGKLQIFWHYYKEICGISGTQVKHYKEDDFELIIYGADLAAWKPPEFDEILVAVSKDEIGSLIFMNIESGNVYAPYDGGADIFIKDMNLQKEIRHKYSFWGSQDPSGL